MKVAHSCRLWCWEGSDSLVSRLTSMTPPSSSMHCPLKEEPLVLKPEHVEVNPFLFCVSDWWWNLKLCIWGDARRKYQKAILISNAVVKVNSALVCVARFCYASSCEEGHVKIANSTTFEMVSRIFRGRRMGLNGEEKDAGFFGGRVQALRDNLRRRVSITLVNQGAPRWCRWCGDEGGIDEEGKERQGGLDEFHIGDLEM